MLRFVTFSGKLLVFSAGLSLMFLKSIFYAEKETPPLT